jgi:hypothetical protein
MDWILKYYLDQIRLQTVKTHVFSSVFPNTWFIVCIKSLFYSAKKKASLKQIRVDGLQLSC